MPFHRVLLALDRTDRAEEIFSRGVEVAAAFGSQLRLVHCLSDPAVGAAADGPSLAWPVFGDASLAYELQTTEADDPRWGQIEAAAREWLRAFQQRAVAAGVADVETECLVGEPGHRLCRLATDWQANLIVLGRKGRSGLEEAFLGSISSSVLHHAPCAVLVVQNSVA